MTDRSIEIPALPELLKSFAPDGVVVTAEPREIVTRLHQAARRVGGGSLRSRSDAGSAEEAETMVDRAVSVEVAVGSGDVSLTPVTSAKTPPERNSEGACSNKMSVVGHIHNPSNKPSFLVQPTLPELQRLVEVLGQMATDTPAGPATIVDTMEQPSADAPATNATAMTEAARRLPLRKVKRDATDAPDGTAVTPDPVIASMDEYRCCIESRQQDSVSAPYLVRRRLSPEAIARVVERYRAGATAAELGAEHGVSKNGMLKLLREQGVQIRGKSLPTAVVNQAMHLHERGMSMRQVSEQLGVSRTALRRNFREMGVEV